MKKLILVVLVFSILFLTHLGITVVWPRLGASFMGSAIWALIMAIVLTWIFYGNKKSGSEGEPDN